MRLINPVVVIACVALAVGIWTNRRGPAHLPEADVATIPQEVVEKPDQSISPFDDQQVVSELLSDPEAVIEAETEAETWPGYLPAMIESLVNSQLARMNDVNLISDTRVVCEDSECEISFTLADFANFMAEREFWAQVQGPPMNARDHQVMAAREESGAWVYTVTLSSEDKNLTKMTEFWKQTAINGLDSDDPFLPARQIMEGMNADVFVENICSIDCPADTQRVIYVEVPLDRSCMDLDGVDRTLLARTANGGLVERNLCLLYEGVVQ